MNGVTNHIIVTGSNGFVGTAIVRAATARGYRVRRCTRGDEKGSDVAVGNISKNTDWTTAIAGIATIVHSAGRAHILNEGASSLNEYRSINVDGTLGLARQAAQAGVKRFIFVSSIGVNGTQTSLPYEEWHPVNPVGAYAISKWEAEEGLREVANEGGMEVVIIRPPLVYGATAPGNFGRLMRAVSSGVPLPLGAIHNKRSLVALDNLVDLIITCLDHPAAANQTFLAADGEDLSTTELLHRMGHALGKPARLVPVPASLLEAGAALLGRRDMAQRLCGSLQVDISKAKSLLGWTPPISVDEGLRRAAQGFLAGKAI